MSNAREDTWTIRIGIGVLIALIGTFLWNEFVQNRPPTAEVAPNLDVEITNPASRSYRVVGVKFLLRKKIPPRPLVGEIELPIIVFTPGDYDPKTYSYRKALQNVEMPANGNLNFRFFIEDPGHKDWIFKGTLTIYYDERQHPKPLMIKDFEIRVR